MGLLLRRNSIPIYADKKILTDVHERFMEIDIDIYIRNDILFIDYGYVQVGDIYKLMEELEHLIDDLPRPFQTISLYERAIENSRDSIRIARTVKEAEDIIAAHINTL